MRRSLNNDIERIMTQGFEHGLASLNQVDRVVYVISNVDFEVNLGGMSGYLYNSVGDQLELLPKAFEAIGCSLLAERSKNLIKVLISHGCEPSDRSMRALKIQSLGERIVHVMEDLERAIQNQEEDYGQALEDYYDKYE